MAGALAAQLAPAPATADGIDTIAAEILAGLPDENDAAAPEVAGKDAAAPAPGDAAAAPAPATEPGSMLARGGTDDDAAAAAPAPPAEDDEPTPAPGPDAADEVDKAPALSEPAVPEHKVGDRVKDVRSPQYGPPAPAPAAPEAEGAEAALAAKDARIAALEAALAQAQQAPAAPPAVPAAAPVAAPVAAPAAPPPAAPQPPAALASVTDRLRELASLRASGALTEAEFARAKAIELG